MENDRYIKMSQAEARRLGYMALNAGQEAWENKNPIVAALQVGTAAALLAVADDEAGMHFSTDCGTFLANAVAVF